MNKKWLAIGGVVLVLLLFAGLVGLRIQDKNKKAAALKAQVPPPPAVAVTAPRQGRVADTLKLPGNVVSQQSVQIIPKVTGRLVSLRVIEGSTVSNGQLIGELEHTELDAQMLQARASAEASKANLAQLVNGPLKTQITQSRASVGQLEASLAQLETNAAQSERDLQRQQNLANEGVITQQQLETSRTQLAALQQQINAMRQQIVGSRASLQQLLDGNRPEQIDAARAQYNQSLATIRLYQAQLSNYRLISPLSGVVTRKFLEAGSYVGPPNPIVTIAQGGRPEIEMFLPERDLEQIRRGQEVAVRSTSLPNQVLRGHITRISPVVDPQTRLLKLTAMLDSPQQLRAGMLLDCSIVLKEKARALMVPVEALITDNNKTVVYTVVNGKVQPKAVKLGLRTPDEVEIQQGLSVSDRVIVRGMNYVEAGDKVQVEPMVKEEKLGGT
jgi:HlyD family secretion protein